MHHFLDKNFVYVDSNQNSLDDFLDELKELLQCPIILDIFTNPVMTPSGNTIEESVMSTLIKNKDPDPFSKTGFCKKLIPNMLIKNIIELYNKYAG